MRYGITAVLIVGVSACSMVWADGMKPAGLRCEYLTDPLGLDVREPRLSWNFEPASRGESQSAREILVATKAGLLEPGKADAWDSGKVAGDRSVQVVYAGAALRPRTQYWWKVRVWDQDGRVSDWSKPATWATGPFDADNWRGNWIGAPSLPNSATENPAVLLRREATMNARPVRAVAYICGLGYYELTINGTRVGDHVLDPGFTNFNKTVLYVTYDVTPLVREGRNAFAVMLGNGWYNMPTPDLFGFERAPWRSRPKLLLNIDVIYADGRRETIDSDTQWKSSTGALVFNCIRAGETWDARLDQKNWTQPGFDDRSWNAAEVAKAPLGRLTAQKMPPMRLTESVKPVRLTEPLPGTWLFDFGVNLTGWAHLEASGSPGALVRLEYNEVLRPDGTLDMNYSHSHTYGRYQTDELILDREGKGTFDGHFTYHGFRYVQVTGLARKPSMDSIVARGLHTDWRRAGEFDCSDERTVLLQKAVIRTLNDSCHSIPGEEATREKMGWTQDGQNVMEPSIYNFEAAPVYWKYLYDMIDAQEDNGSVPPIVPTDGWGLTSNGGRPHPFSDPWWGATLPYVAWKLYEYYDDRRALEVAYEPMKRWARYLQGTSRDYLVDWSLGDWQEAGTSGVPKRTPVIETSTAGYYYSVIAVRDAAKLLGKAADANEFARLGERIRESYNQHFYHAATAEYARNSQTSLAVSLWLGLVPDNERDRALRALIDNIHEWHDHTSTGFVGIMPEVNGLVDWGYPGLAWKIVDQDTPPNWWHMISDGNSTLGEALAAGLSGSRHHPFGACIGEWYYRVLGGIRPDPAEPGFRHILIRPAAVGDLKWTKARYSSIRGTIESSWIRRGNRFELDLTIPANTTATVILPASRRDSVTESGKPIASAPGVRSAGAGYQIGSGSYRFECELTGGQQD